MCEVHFFKENGGKKGRMQRCGFRKCIGSRVSAVSFYSFIFLFSAAERSYAGTAAGLDGSVLKRVK